MPLKIGIWDTPAVEYLTSGLAGANLGLETVALEPAAAMESVLTGAVDVALVPTLQVVLGVEGVEVLPAVALSSWHYPYARLHLPDGLADAPETVFFSASDAQEALIGRVVLREHYGMRPEFIAVSEAELDHASGARLLVGRDVPSLKLEGTALDLGEEWFEMANYPMVWGVFVTRKGLANQDTVDRLRTMVERSEALRPQWADSKDSGESVRRFFEDDVRLRFDDLAVASITQLMDHAFYHDLTDEIRDFPIAVIDAEDETDQSRSAR